MTNEPQPADREDDIDENTILTVFDDPGGLRMPPTAAPGKPVEMVLPEPSEQGPTSNNHHGQAGHLPVRFKIRLASEQGVRSKASYLIEKMYEWRGYHAPVSTSAAPSAPDRITLVASDSTRALATITIGLDAGNGLVADELYGSELEQLRAGGCRLCEFTKLAIDRDQRSRELLAMMFHIAYMYAHCLHRCTDVLVEVNPRHVRFYKQMLGFEAAGPERSCSRVNGAPAVLLRLALAHAQREIGRLGGHKEAFSQVRSLYPFFFAPAEQDGIVGRLKAIG